MLQARAGISGASPWSLNTRQGKQKGRPGSTGTPFFDSWLNQNWNFSASCMTREGS
jgi:hypothetical protein